MDLGRALSELRKDSNTSLQELEELTSIPMSDLFSIENGGSMDKEQLNSILRALKADPLDFILRATERVDMVSLFDFNDFKAFHSSLLLSKGKGTNLANKNMVILTQSETDLVKDLLIKEREQEYSRTPSTQLNLTMAEKLKEKYPINVLTNIISKLNK